MIEPHNIAHLNSLAIAVQTRYEEPVAPRVERRVHRGSLGELDGHDMLPNECEGAKQTGAIESVPGNRARFDPQC